MSNTMKILVGLLLPLSGTVLGAAMVFFLKREMSPRLQKVLLGFAAGVMIAASVWSLLIPAIEMAEAGGRVAWLPAVVGFLLGIAFLLLLDSVIPAYAPGRRASRRQTIEVRQIADAGIGGDAA